MIFAAGLGTRLKPFTLNAPKALFPVNGKPLLQRNIEYLKSFGFTDFVINVHHFADKIIDFLEKNQNFDVNIQISDETEELLETGGGLVKAAPLLNNERFLLINADILTDLDIDKMLNFHLAHQPLVTLAVSKRESSRQLLFQHNHRLCGWENLKTNELKGEKKLSIPLAFSGIHIIEPSIFELMSQQGKFSIIAPYLELMTKEKIMGFDHTGDKLIDVGKPENLIAAEKWFQ